MTTALDRLEAAIGDDGPITREQQLDLVADLLARRARTWFCSNCLRDWPDTVCGECGANLVARPSGRAGGDPP